MTDMTDSELDEIEQRAAATTPGPWTAYIEGRDHTSGDDFIMIGEPGTAQIDVYVTHYSGTSPKPAPDADLDFIAHARRDIPQLVAEIRRLRSQSTGGHQAD